MSLVASPPLGAKPARPGACPGARIRPGHICAHVHVTRGYACWHVTGVILHRKSRGFHPCSHWVARTAACAVSMNMPAVCVHLGRGDGSEGVTRVSAMLPRSFMYLHVALASLHAMGPKVSPHLSGIAAHSSRTRAWACLAVRGQFLGGYACRGETRAHVRFARSIRYRCVPGVILRRMSRGGRPNSLRLVLAALRVNGVRMCAGSICMTMHGGRVARSRLTAHLCLLAG